MCITTHFLIMVLLCKKSTGGGEFYLPQFLDTKEFLTLNSLAQAVGLIEKTHDLPRTEKNILGVGFKNVSYKIK